MHLPLKEYPWSKFVQRVTNVNAAVYLMDCAPASENILAENDLYFPSPLWTKTATGDCIGQGNKRQKK
jgi:hypothetical protein